MEGGEALQLPEAPFPAPPPFWRHFTAANEESLRDLESSENGVPKKLPLPLAYLRPPPPPPPSAKEYTIFGQAQVVDATRPLTLPPKDDLLFDPEDPNVNLPVLLSRLTKSLMLNFLEFNTILSSDPTKHAEKMDDLRKILLNIHLVINLYRPHQAREGIREMLEAKLEDGQREIDECDAIKERIERFLAGVGNFQADTGEETGQANGAHTAERKDQLEEQKRLWKMIHDLDLEPKD